MNDAKSSIIKRYLYFIIALFFNSLGVALITIALLGTSPISSIPYVLSLSTQWSMGEWTIAFNVIFIMLDLILMKREDIRQHVFDLCVQLPVTVLFGLFIDLSMAMLSVVDPTSYAMSVATLVVGCIILALGVSMEVQADVAMLPGEFLVRVISKVSGCEFGNVKLFFDVTMVVVACILSYVFAGEINGVREGTVICALLVGPITRVIRPRLSFVDGWLYGNKRQEDDERVAEDDNEYPFVITITREFGSGGRILAQNIAKEMNIRYYDKELIAMATEESKLNEQYIIENEQKASTSDLLSLITQGYESRVEKSLSSSDRLFVAQSKVIRNVAKKEPCVILGRLADYVLNDWPKHRIVRVFCYCDTKTSYERCNNVYQDPWTEADIIKKNEERIAHYEHYTGRKWGDPHNYDIMVNTGVMTIELATRLISALAVEKYN